MLKSKFLLFLFLLFCISFWWAGGGTFVKNNLPILLPALSIPSVLTGQTIPPTNPGIWNRIHRVIAIREAVNAKLDKSNYVRLQDIPLVMQQAIIAIEDNRFYKHPGIDVEGVFRAMLVNAQNGEMVQGASTITQQLIKNLLLSQEQTAERKMEEAVLSLVLEMRYSKEDILEMYLNTIYFGSGAYGIGNASKIYFNKTPANVNLAEASLLAGLPNAPSLLSPYVNYSAAKQRQAIVLSTMVKNGYIGPTAAEEAKNAPLKLAK